MDGACLEIGLLLKIHGENVIPNLVLLDGMHGVIYNVNSVIQEIAVAVDNALGQQL